MSPEALACAMSRRKPRHVPWLVGRFLCLALLPASGGWTHGALAGEAAWHLLGPYRSRTRCLAIDPGEPETVYAAYAGFVLRSSDGGQTWTAGSEGMKEGGPSVEGIVLRPGDPPTLYAGTNRGVFRSTDGGKSWVCINKDFRVVGDFIRVRGDEGGFYSWKSARLFRSVDHCQTWNEIARAPEWFSYLSACAEEPGLMLAGVSKRVGVSSDGGRTWSYSRPDPSRPGLVRVVARSCTFPRVLYAGTQFGGEAHGNFYRSADGGSTWSKVDILPEAEALRRHIQVYAIVALPGEPSRLLVGTTAGVFVGSDDGAAVSFEGEAQIPARTILDLRAISSAGRVYAATDNGVYVSRDLGRTWSVSFSGFPRWSVRQIAVSRSNPGTIYAATGKLWRKRQDEPSWERLLRNSHSIAIDPGPPETIYARSSARGKLVRSTDGGYSWETFTNIDYVLKLRHADGCLYAYCHRWSDGKTSLFRSADRGKTWQDLNLPYAGRVEHFHVDSEDGSRVYVGVRPPGFWHVITARKAVSEKTVIPLKVCRTLDGGRTWLDVPAIDGQEWLAHLHSYATIIAGSAARGKVLYAATFRGAPAAPASVLRSLDGGKTWEALPGQSQMGAVTSLAVDPRDYSTVFAGCLDGGIYLSVDAGANWRVVRKPHEWDRANEILVRPHGRGVVYIATSSGVYRRSLEEVLAKP